MITADDGVSLWTASSGMGPDLALAHGGPGLWDYLEPLAIELEPCATVHRWDQRGCGRSEDRGPYTVDRFVADMDAVRAASAADRWIVGGHSWGAVLALVYALRHPDRALGVLYIAGTGLAWARWRPLHHVEAKRRLG
ncbi:MAG: alpha/beta hydrolase, partial [Candidatus Nephthysia bennettiae]